MRSVMSVVLKPRKLRPRSAHHPPGLGECSFIINGNAPEHNWAGLGCLSIKSFHGGEALYDIGRGRFRIGSDSYLILNQSQHYEITVQAQPTISSFCLFFEDGFAEDVQYSLTTPAAKLLDNPQPPPRETLRFFERTYQHDDLLSPALFRLRAQLPAHKHDEAWINEQLSDVMRRLLLVHQRVRHEVERFPALRAATREELYRRLHRAKDFLAASFDQSVTLDDAAAIACLSPNHFLRTFQQAFGQTPHQFLTAQRITRAERLLRQTTLPVTDICLAVGFESLGSFSTLFRRHRGLSPEQFRRSKR